MLVPDVNLRGNGVLGGAGDAYALYLPLTFSINLKLLRKKEKM